MKVTRILISDTPPELAGICEAMGFVRGDIWRRYGALGTTCKNANAIRKQISAAGLYDGFHVDGTIRAETTKDIVNDILLYKAAAMIKVRRAIAATRHTQACDARALDGDGYGVMALPRLGPELKSLLHWEPG